VLSGPESPTLPQAVCCFSNPKRERGRKRGPRSRFLKLRYLTNRNAVQQQSPGSRSAPWVSETSKYQTPTGFYTNACKTPLGFASHIDRHPRVRFATLGFGVKRLRRRDVHDNMTFRYQTAQLQYSRFGLRFTPLFRENRLSQQPASGRVILDRNSCTNREAARESKRRVRRPI
jgi:hypothetical protein